MSSLQICLDVVTRRNVVVLLAATLILELREELAVALRCRTSKKLFSTPSMLRIHARIHFRALARMILGHLLKLLVDVAFSLAVLDRSLDVCDMQRLVILRTITKVLV
jgi:hypothetical protein